MQVSKWILGRLSRVTSSGRFVPEVDGLRFAAIMSVVLFHSYGCFFTENFKSWQWGWPLLGGVIFQGWFGVQLFFVISGFILSMPMAEQHLLGSRPVSLKKYFLRRVTRLEPPYLINLAILFGLIVLLRGGDFRSLLPHFGASCGYFHNIAYFPDGSWINPAAWSLEIEVQFYILAPLLGCVFMIRSNAWRRIVLVGATWLSLAGHLPGDWCHMHSLHMTLAGQLNYFLIGFLLSEIYVGVWKGPQAKGARWDVLGAAAWLGLPFAISWWPTQQLLAPWMILAAYVGAFRGRWLNRLFVNPWIVVIGGMCYTIYLYHQTILDFIKPLIGQTQKDHLNLWAPLQAAALLGGVLACSAVLFVLVEKPFMRKDWPQRLWQWARRWTIAPLRAKPVAQAVPAEAEREPTQRQDRIK